MATPKKRKRIAKELIEVIENPDKEWRGIHTWELCRLIKNQGNGEWDQITAELSKEYNAQKAELAKTRKEIQREAELNRQEIFNQMLEEQLPRMAEVLLAIQESGIANAVDENGNINPALIDRKDAEVSLKACAQIAKIMGMDRQKIEVSQGNAFEGVEF